MQRRHENEDGTLTDEEKPTFRYVLREGGTRGNDKSAHYDIPLTYQHQIYLPLWWTTTGLVPKVPIIPSCVTVREFC